jgi:polysaccharide export outer membrane protein
VTAAVLTAALAGCGGMPQAPAYPTADGADFVEPDSADRPGIPDDRPPAAVLRPGDTLRVQIVSAEQQTLEGVVVDATGNLHLPLSGDVPVAGLGLVEAEDRVRAAMQQYDKLVQVNLQQTARGGQRATVLGVVNTQGAVELVPGARVTDLVAGAGGPITTTTGPNPVPVADLSAAVLIRKGKVLPVDLAKALRGDPLHNVYVHPGDHLYIPPSIGQNISVLGQVGAPQVFAPRPGMRLTEALALAGGVTVGADKGDIRVIRGTLVQPKVYRADLAALVDGDTHDVMLRPGDIVFVTDHPIEDFNEVMGTIAPALSIGLSGAALGLAIDQTN